jgi:hypothetical protein
LLHGLKNLFQALHYPCSHWLLVWVKENVAILLLATYFKPFLLLPVRFLDYNWSWQAWQGLLPGKMQAIILCSRSILPSSECNRSGTGTTSTMYTVMTMIEYRYMKNSHSITTTSHQDTWTTL